MAGAPTDHLANERTFLAWMRTAITVMAFGFVVARFGLFLHAVNPATPSSTAPLSDGVGVFLVFLGTAILVLSLLRFQATRNGLLEGRFRTDDRMELVLTGMLVVVGAGVAFFLIFGG